MSIDLDHVCTRARYLRGTDCLGCRAAHLRYTKAYKHRTKANSATGVPANPMRVDATHVREHLLALIASGWTRREVEVEARLSKSHASHIALGHYPTCHRDIAARILALEPLEPISDDYVDPVVVDRLIQAYPDPIWRRIGATRNERVTAAEQLLATVRRIRRPQRAAGIAEQWADGPTITGIEDCLGLRQTRDFGRPVGETA